VTDWVSWANSSVAYSIGASIGTTGSCREKHDDFLAWFLADLGQ